MKINNLECGGFELSFTHREMANYCKKRAEELRKCLLNEDYPEIIQLLIIDALRMAENDYKHYEFLISMDDMFSPNNSLPNE